ncbi:hypothetical protein WICPIJ_009054 [Wickerhamomyces pijperi]|uniref:Uncharacterized protein n=1 Tax=Wickerhamomyces pijperi TaxID=599730 RepID=A0A9P8PQM7_WICPI|nr:hypothetical protein WICPIJ_009054 [Wickerhamomyces pijperi]
MNCLSSEDSTEEAAFKVKMLESSMAEKSAKLEDLNKDRACVVIMLVNSFNDSDCETNPTNLARISAPSVGKEINCLIISLQTEFSEPINASNKASKSAKTIKSLLTNCFKTNSKASVELTSSTNPTTSSEDKVKPRSSIVFKAPIFTISD